MWVCNVKKSSTICAEVSATSELTIELAFTVKAAKVSAPGFRVEPTGSGTGDAAGEKLEEAPPAVRQGHIGRAVWTRGEVEHFGNRNAVSDAQRAAIVVARTQELNVGWV